MLKVENFLGCAKLETGGVVIGWVCLIGDIISLVVSLLGLVVLCIFGCDDLERILVEHHSEIPENFRDLCGVGRGVGIGFLVFFVLLSIVMIYFSWSCIKGSRNRNHSQVKPLMIIMAIVSVLSFLNILSFTSAGIISGIVYGVIYGYAFVVLHSLFTLFRDESERGFNPQYHAPGSKV